MVKLADRLFFIGDTHCGAFREWQAAYDHLPPNEQKHFEKGHRMKVSKD